MCVCVLVCVCVRVWIGGGVVLYRVVTMALNPADAKTYRPPERREGRGGREGGRILIGGREGRGGEILIGVGEGGRGG